MIITYAEVKSILNLSDNSYQTKIETLIPFIQDWVIDYCNNKFEVERKYPVDYYDERFTHRDVIYLYTNTISFDSATKTITDSDSNFINAGFKVGFSIKIEGTTYNEGIYTISSVSSGSIVVSESLVDEDSEYYTLLTLVEFPKGIKLPVAKLIAEELKNNSVENGDRVVSERVGDASFTYASAVSGEYPKSILKQFKQWKRVHFV